MKYLALIRGINVGGRNNIRMEDLRRVVIETGYTEVSTYIQSGNVIFESEERSADNIAKKLERNILQAFHCDTRIVVLSEKDLQQVTVDSPREWRTQEDLRKYIAFIIPPATAEDVAKEIKLTEGVDSLKVGKKVIYMSTLLSGITRSGFSKLVGTKVYKFLTIRNLNTTNKLLELMNA